MRVKNYEKPNAMRDARMAAGLTQQELAEKSGVYYRLIQRVECGSSSAGNMTAKKLIAIADTLGVDPRELIREEPENEG